MSPALLPGIEALLSKGGLGEAVGYHAPAEFVTQTVSLVVGQFSS